MLVILLYNLVSHCLPLFFFFNDTATTEIYTLSLHDALPILARQSLRCNGGEDLADRVVTQPHRPGVLAQRRRPYRLSAVRSEEHTSELQSRSDLVCRLLLEKKKKKQINQKISRRKCLQENTS